MFLPIGEGNLTLAISLKILKDLLYRSKARVPAGLVYVLCPWRRAVLEVLDNVGEPLRRGRLPYTPSI
jgi:hypothetical protein